jgi:hypothetical protein
VKTLERLVAPDKKMDELWRESLELAKRLNHVGLEIEWGGTGKRSRLRCMETLVFCHINLHNMLAQVADLRQLFKDDPPF